MREVTQLENYESKLSAAKLERSSWNNMKLYWSAVLGGIVIALAAAAASTDNQVVNGLIFPMGLVILMLSGFELFTGNCITALPVMTRTIRFTNWIRMLFFTWCGNAFGTIVTAVLLGWAGEIPSYTLQIAEQKASMGFLEAYASGLLCNIAVCLGVYLFIGARDAIGKIVGAFLPVVLFAIVGYEHVVANFYYLTAGVLLGLPESAYWQLFSVTLGNLSGGILLGVLLYHTNIVRRKDYV